MRKEERNLNQTDPIIRLKKAREIDGSYYKAETIAELSEQFSGKEREDILREALFASQHIQDKEDLDKALDLIKNIGPSKERHSDRGVCKNLQENFNNLTTYNRRKCLEFLDNNAQYIYKCGEKEAFNEISKAIEDVGKWWP